MSDFEKLVNRFLNEYVDIWHKEHGEPCAKECKERVRITLEVDAAPWGRVYIISYDWTSDVEPWHVLGSGTTMEAAIVSANGAIDAARQRNYS